MKTDDLVRADHEAMLIVGSFAQSLHDPESWERFTNRLFDEWGKRYGIDLAALEGRNAAGRIPATENTLPSVRAAASDYDAAASPNDGSGTPASG